jgi:hypothetical protein
VTSVFALSERAHIVPRREAWWGLAAGIVCALPLSLALSGVFPARTLDVAAALCFLGYVALAVTRFEVAVLLAFVVLGFVVVDPAPVDLLLVVLVAIALATGRFTARVPAAVFAALSALLALNLLSAVEVVSPGRAAVFLATTAYLMFFAYWLSGYVDSRRRARLVAGGYLVAAAGSALLGLLALFVGAPAHDVLVESGRARGFFQDPNVFGPFLVPMALVLVEDLLTPRLFAFRRTVKLTLLVLLVLGVVFSFSRGAWGNLVVGLAVVLGVVGLRRGGGRKALMALLLTLTLAGAVAFVLAASGEEGFLLERAHLQAYDTTRFSTQVVGVQSAERYPFGVGPGQFESYAPQSAHSTYVRVLGEQGLPGLLALVLALTFTLMAALGNAIAGRDSFGIGSAALLGSWCGILVNSVVVDTLHWRHFWVVAALIWVGRTRRRPLRLRPAVAADEATA